MSWLQSAVSASHSCATVQGGFLEALKPEPDCTESVKLRQMLKPEVHWDEWVQQTVHDLGTISISNSAAFVSILQPFYNLNGDGRSCIEWLDCFGISGRERSQSHGHATDKHDPVSASETCSKYKDTSKVTIVF